MNKTRSKQLTNLQSLIGELLSMNIKLEDLLVKKQLLIKEIIEEMEGEMKKEIKRVEEI